MQAVFRDQPRKTPRPPGTAESPAEQCGFPADQPSTKLTPTLLRRISKHGHLLVETPLGNLGAFMGSVLTGYTVYFTKSR